MLKREVKVTKRPTFLTIWLVLMTVAGVFTLYSYTLGSASITQTLPNIPSWSVTLLALMSAVNLASVVMLWMWKKAGFYLLIASAIIVASINGVILGPIGIGGSIFALVGVGILYLAMKPVWQNFK